NIIDMACSNPAYSGMGCTMVLAVLVGNDLHIGHVGDARAYRFNPKRIALVTEDHSRVMEMVRAGHLSMEEARLSPMKNELTQAVGGHIGIVPEYCHLALNRQDRILLCSDGLWDMLPDDEIQQIVQNAACARKACEELIEAANRSGGEDNITAVVIFHQARGTPRPGDTVPRVGMHRT
ncbi:MAG: SpoIIE family protein phosphatase, partial [Desulfobacteraceae bacterium]